MADDRIIKEIADALGKVPARFGLPPTVGRIWSILYFKGEMTQDKLRKETKSSLGAISQALTILENLGLVEICGKEGRKNIYCATSISSAKRKQMEYALHFQIEPMRQLFGEKLKEASDPKLKERIRELDKMYGNMEGALSIILKTPFGR